MCIGHQVVGVCRYYPHECARSAQRVRTGQAFLGEPYEHLRWYQGIPPYVQPPYCLPREVKFSSEEIRRLEKPSPEACTLCSKGERSNFEVLARGGLRQWHQVFRAPEYEVQKCGHVFHEACLNAYLTEPSEMNFLTCVKCENVKAEVRANRWDVEDVEEAIEQLKVEYPLTGDAERSLRIG